MNKEHLYAFYGSLRKGMYNYEGLKSGMEYQKTVEISGFKLFSLGAYPCIIETGDSADKLTVDLFTVTGDNEYRIHRMELGAGYLYKEVEIDGKMFGIYVYPKTSLDYFLKRGRGAVPGGDWVKYLQSKNDKIEVG